MKKSTLAILTAVIAFAPLTAFAQDTQNSAQIGGNSAAAVGYGNYIDQDAHQTSFQDQLNSGGYGVPDAPDAQNSLQVNTNEAAAIGEYNVIDQEADQSNVQLQTDIESYYPHY
ncbi:hypothetical protein [Pleurocapsa sp. PCC 7319]|uniref:hypothetical protein n=1 Tax=Pleurocapsa sp. PCC 7319 TaxID=118161 RepID=UPI0003464B2B|nr:hypothetical protein [Pleurocapsa sp. PCC 7319]